MQGAVIEPPCATQATFGWANSGHFLYNFVFVGNKTAGTRMECPSGSAISGWKFKTCYQSGSSGPAGLLLRLRCKPVPLMVDFGAQTLHNSTCDTADIYAQPGVAKNHEYMDRLGTATCPPNSVLVSMGIRSCGSQTALQWTVSCAPLLDAPMGMQWQIRGPINGACDTSTEGWGGHTTQAQEWTRSERCCDRHARCYILGAP